MAENQFVVFKLGKEKYGVDINNVGGISEFLEITKVPNAPFFIDGVINLRGDIIPIINLKKRFNIKEDEALGKDDKRIIIINYDERDIGYIVDDASQVIKIDDKDIEPTPTIIGKNNRKYITGMGKVNNEIVILLDLIKILNEEELEEVVNFDA